ncbi:hypothetical protein M011DRAFT_482211 [Sporormia fimetaria CBS 119925]|uniref:Uncharacterized protein n=1 Tax=Sporormia fimetaria CBS 119925 TaxID=1340428 RepID=A0A6A6UWK1_9PLEO|nr:hypothetical protein M011DRAFT_482211 [Sporormia fimetaria CBS 119925]
MESSGHEAASQQLLAELALAEREAMTPSQALATSAQRNADLLNSVNQTTSHSASISMSSKTKAATSGRLKRPKAKLNRIEKTTKVARRDDIYDVPDSPEKEQPRSIPATAARKAPRPQKSSRTPVLPTVGEGRTTRQRSLRNATPHSEETIPAKKATTLPNEDSPRRASKRLAGESPNVSGIDWAKPIEANAGKSPISKRKADDPGQSTRPPKSPRKEKEPSGAERLGKRRSSPLLVVQAVSTSTTPIPRSTDRQLSDSPAGETDGASQREENHDQDGISPVQPHPMALLRRKPAAPGKPSKAQKSSSKSKSNEKPTESSRKPCTRRPVTPDAERRQKEPTAHPVEIPDSSPQEKSSSDDEANEQSESDVIDETPQHEMDESDQPGIPGGGDQDSEHDSASTHLDLVLKFARTSEREGDCMTEAGQKMRKRLKRAMEYLEQQELDLDEISAFCDEVLKLFRLETRPPNSYNQKAFKEDAFAYVFVLAARFLAAVYKELRRQPDDPQSRIEVLCILLSVMRAILNFKRIISSWGVKLGLRHTGERIIKNVEQKFMIPLRIVEQEQSRQLEELREAEYDRKQRQADEEKRRGREEEERKAEEALTKIKARRERWRQLHEQRLGFEKSLDRKRLAHLAFKPFDDVEERDSNGVPFERASVFRDRETPFAHRKEPEEHAEWTDEQTAALIGGLKTYAGPDVFRHIFRKFCQRGGPLRDFNVSEITSEANFFRSKTIDVYERSEREVPDWVMQIPVLP